LIVLVNFACIMVSIFELSSSWRYVLRWQLAPSTKLEKVSTKMGTISPRKKSNGKTVYLARIRIKRGDIEYKETLTFDRKQAANGWIAKREEELNQPGALEALTKERPTLADAIAVRSVTTEA
jgi:hypothetical protein